MRLAFRRSEAGRFKRLKERWRRPGGIHNKMREGKKGIKPKIGWKKPEVEEIPIISNMSGLNGLKTKEIIISSKAGMKKRLELEKFCVEKKIKILNIKKLVKKKKIKKKKVEKETATEKTPETKETSIQKEIKTEPIKKIVDKKEVNTEIKEKETKQVAKESKKDTKPPNTATSVSTENKTEIKK
ncbi:MAG: hypothetical protein DRP06_01005 [Candidatus Aenigmatarchaeota archaeon]|nr:MAG: hypothetical protein DRP06_01005 [Candidatus Aenigmarchaeota archaeon]